MSKKKIDTGSVEYELIQTSTVEEYLEIDSSLVEFEKNNSLIRMEMNIIEFPIFSKNRKLSKGVSVKYHFSSKDNSYLHILPLADETIPGEFEEKVFMSLLKIFKEKNFNRVFYCTNSEILDNITSSSSTRKSLYPRLKTAIKKLSETSYRFSNLFYSSEISGIADSIIRTTLLSSTTITLKDSSELEKKYFSDKRVKEIYKINLSEEIYSNLIKKGYLVFDIDKLLSIKDSVTRSLYTQITKWRNTKLYLRRPAFFIARKIPLSWKGKSIKNSISTIRSSFEELKSLGYISDFNEINVGKIDTTEFELFFNEEHNAIKQKEFYTDRINYEGVIHTVEENINDYSYDIALDFSTQNVPVILDIFGPKGATLKTLPHVIKEALSKYEFEFVRDTAEYTAYNAKASLLKYFKEALVNNWADEYISKKKAKENKIAAKKIEVIEEAHIVESTDSKVLNLSWEDFEKLPIESQNKIKDKAYKIYLEETNSSDTKSSRGIFEKTQKALIVKIYNQDIEEPSVIAEPEKKVDNKKVYPNLAKFCTDFYKFAKKANSEIVLDDILSFLKSLGEYEDDFVYASYDLESNTGYYELKK